MATGTFLWLFLRQASLGDTWREMRALPGWSIAAALGFVLANSAFIALRWRYLFAAARYSTSARGLFPIFCVGAAANNVIPARGGDLLRIASARETYRIPAFVTAGTLFAERLLDGVVLAVWILLGALMIGEDGPPAARRSSPLGRHGGRAGSGRPHCRPSRHGRAGRLARHALAARPLAHQDRSRDR